MGNVGRKLLHSLATELQIPSLASLIKKTVRI
jgi:hypothetical protein